MLNKVAVREVGEWPYLLGGQGIRLDGRGAIGVWSGDGSESWRGGASLRL